MQLTLNIQIQVGELHRLKTGGGEHSAPVFSLTMTPYFDHCLAQYRSFWDVLHNQFLGLVLKVTKPNTANQAMQEFNLCYQKLSNAVYKQTNCLLHRQVEMHS